MKKIKQEDIKEIICDFVDFLLPELKPAEVSVYLYLLRNSILRQSSKDIRTGKRTIAAGFGKGIRGVQTKFEHIRQNLIRLEEKGCIKIGDVNREGTLFSVLLPREIPLVAEKITSLVHHDKKEDYFNDPNKRQIIFERDKWICQYCGEKVTQKDATIDHYVPQSKGGKHNKENLRTSCFICNAIKSGKNFDEAAPLLLKNIQERKQKKSL